MPFFVFAVGDLKRAAECVATHQILQPGHEEMTRNRDYFIDQDLISDSWFVPRKEVVFYHKRYTYEDKLERYIEKAFVLKNEELKVNKDAEKEIPVGTNLIPDS